MQTIVAKRERLGFRIAPVCVVLLACVFSFAWFLAGAGQAFACSCIMPGSPTEELEKFDAVFVGRVFTVKHSYSLEAKMVNREDRSTIGFDVSTVWKGVIHETTYITTPPTGGSCGYTFIEGEEYIVYASNSHYGDDSYTASICSRTALLSAAQADLEALGGGKAPQAGTKGPAPADTEDTATAISAGWVFALVLAVLIFVVGAGGFVAYAARAQE